MKELNVTQKELVRVALEHGKVLVRIGRVRQWRAAEVLVNAGILTIIEREYREHDGGLCGLYLALRIGGGV